VRGSTAAISTMEHEPGGVQGLRAMLERVIPSETVVGASEAVPILDGRLALGTWQQLVLLDLDDRPRERTVVVQILS
jgi:thiamine phosphate synthase YjbQ (UPF0047 family)